MKIRMTKTIQGSIDGVTVVELVNGTDYSTPDTPRGDRLAKYHIRRGDAVLAPVDLARRKRKAKA